MTDKEKYYFKKPKDILAMDCAYLTEELDKARKEAVKYCKEAEEFRRETARLKAKMNGFVEVIRHLTSLSVNPI